MDIEYALLLLEAELNDELEVNHQQLDRLAQAVVVAAGTETGYSSFAWQSGKKLIDIATSSVGLDGAEFFDSFGWRALANGIQNAIAHDRILNCLSYRTTGFVPTSLTTTSVFDHLLVESALDRGLAVNHRPFVKPAELGVADHQVQTEFVGLLQKLSEQDRDRELLRQWSAAALRVLPTQSPSHLTSALVLLQGLHNDERPVTTYYVFRALAEYHHELWEQPLALEVLKSLVGHCIEDELQGKDLLVEFCSDDEVVRILNNNHELQLLTGFLAVALSQKYAEPRVEPTAWQFVGDMYGYGPLFAHALESYLINGSLPDLPQRMRDRVDVLEKQFTEALIRAESELRHRRYGKLAAQIYQQNMEDVFDPILSEIRHGSCTEEFVQQILEIDPDELVVGSDLQQVSTRQTGTPVTRKMVGEMKRALAALEAAARKRIELEQARIEMLTRDLSEFDMYLEYEALIEKLGPSALWAMQSLLSPLWQGMAEGNKVTERELEVLSYATRKHQ